MNGNNLLEQLKKDITAWENQEIEFMEVFPTHPHELAKEIAAFATKNPGSIYIGVDNSGNIKAVDPGTDTPQALKDCLQRQIANIVQNNVRPAIEVRAEFIEVPKGIVVKINVPKGREPVYYSNGIPYIRVLTSAERATPDQVKNLHRQYFLGENIATAVTKDNHLLFKALIQLSDLEIMGIDPDHRKVNPDLEQLRYDLDATGKALVDISNEPKLDDKTLAKTIKETGVLLQRAANHQLYIDGGKSYSEFLEMVLKAKELAIKLLLQIKKRLEISKEDLEEINDSLLKNINELFAYWEERAHLLKSGEITTLKENLRILAYNFNRISNIPLQDASFRYFARLKEVAKLLREVASDEFFRWKGNPLDAIKSNVEKAISICIDIKKQAE